MPNTPSGASRITMRTIQVIAADRSPTTARVPAPAWRSASPSPMAQASRPM